MTEQTKGEEYKVSPCIDIYHNFAQLGHEGAPTVYCTKCGTPITYKIGEAK